MDVGLGALQPPTGGVGGSSNGSDEEVVGAEEGDGDNSIYN